MDIWLVMTMTDQSCNKANNSGVSLTNLVMIQKIFAQHTCRRSLLVGAYVLTQQKIMTLPA